MRLPRSWNYNLKAFSVSQITLYFEIVLLHKMSYKLLILSFVPHRSITTNGPAVELVGVAERLEAVTTKALLLRAGSRYTAARSEAWRGFCKSRYKFFRSRACRGTSFIEAGILSRYRMFFRGTGAVSRYKFYRSQKTVTM